MYFHVIHYTFTWYFIVPLPFPPPSLPRHDFLAVSTAKYCGCWLHAKASYEPENCNKIYMFHGMNISLMWSIFLSFVFTIIQSISEVAEEEEKMYVNFSYESWFWSRAIFCSFPERLYLFKFIYFVEYIPCMQNK